MADNLGQSTSDSQRIQTTEHKEKSTNLIYPTFICYLFVHKIKINNRLNVFATIDRA